VPCLHAGADDVVLAVCPLGMPLQVSLRQPVVNSLRLLRGCHVLRRDGSEASARLLADTFVSRFPDR